MESFIRRLVRQMRKSIFFAIRCGKQGEESLDPAEVLKLHEVSIEEFKRMVASGEIKHGAGLAAWARWMSR